MNHDLLVVSLSSLFPSDLSLQGEGRINQGEPLGGEAYPAKPKGVAK